MKSRVHVFVKGRVQGVFFRSETRRLARKNNVDGWVRNLSDGRVEAVFEGTEEDVQKLVEFCMNGPTGATVVTTEVIDEEYEGTFDGFQIRW